MSFHEFFTARKEERNQESALAHSESEWETNCEENVANMKWKKKKQNAKTHFIDTIQINANDLYILYPPKCIIQRSRIEWEQTAVTDFLFAFVNSVSFATLTARLLLLLIFFVANYLWLEKKCRAQQYDGKKKTKKKFTNSPQLQPKRDTHAENARALLLCVLAQRSISCLPTCFHISPMLVCVRTLNISQMLNETFKNVLLRSKKSVCVHTWKCAMKMV